MRLTASEVAHLARLINASFPQIERFEMVLSMPPIEKPIDEVAEPGVKDVRIFQVVSASNDQGWAARLCDGLESNPTANPDLKKYVQELRLNRAIAPGVEAQYHLVLDGAPFVNHRSLREAIGLACQNGGPKVLRVTGGELSGKSYSQFLINHVGRLNGHEVMMAPALDSSTTAADIAMDLAEFLNLPEPPVIHDNPGDATEAKRLVRWFIAKARRIDEHWWLIFDGFNDLTIHESVTMFISGIAQEIGRGQLDNVQLFLLGWDRPISGPPPGRIREQSLVKIDKEEVSNYLKDLVETLAMPEDYATTEEILVDCFAGAEAQPDLAIRAAVLTEKLSRVVLAAQASARAQSGEVGP